MTRMYERLLLAGGAAYVLGLGWAMMNTSYDVWGAFVLMPIVVLLTVPLLRRRLRDEEPVILRIALIGLLAKFAGSGFRYYVAFDLYGGSTDAGRYHDFGRALSGAVRSGEASPFDVIPSGIGTPFIERLTALVYTVVGSSRLGGFIIFSWLAYIGALWFYRAAALAVPALDRRLYAILIFFGPSLVYWPSSIGKEAWMIWCLGAASFGGAKLLTGRWGLGAFMLTAAGLVGAAFVRPHFAAIWLGALVVALIFGLVSGRSGRGARGRFGSLVFAGLAVAGLVVVAGITLRYLDPGDGGDAAVNAPVSGRVTSIFEETTRRSEQGGSGFEPITIGGPQTWPYAIIRTLTRPLLHEARSFAELIPAAEMTALFALALLGWRRILNIPQQLGRTPYLVLAFLVLIMFGLAFTTIGNLGILTRQRSLIMPLFMLFFCLTPWPSRADKASLVAAGRVADDSQRPAVAAARR